MKILLKYCRCYTVQSNSITNGTQNNGTLGDIFVYRGSDANNGTLGDIFVYRGSDANQDPHYGKPSGSAWSMRTRKSEK